MEKLFSFPSALSKDLHFRLKRFVAIGPLDAQLIIQMEKLESLCILFDLRHCHGELEQKENAANLKTFALSSSPLLGGIWPNIEHWNNIGGRKGNI